MTQLQRYVLHVEDDPDHSDLIRRCFKKLENEFDLVQLQDGEQVLSHLDEQVHRGVALPHLLLLDLRMPKKDGLEVLRELKGHELFRTLPVVILTTSDAPSDIQGAAEAHANGYLVKPTDLKSLRALLRQVDDYWLSTDKLSAQPS